MKKIEKFDLIRHCMMRFNSDWEKHYRRALEVFDEPEAIPVNRGMKDNKKKTKKI